MSGWASRCLHGCFATDFRFGYEGDLMHFESAANVGADQVRRPAMSSNSWTVQHQVTLRQLGARRVDPAAFATIPARSSSYACQARRESSISRARRATVPGCSKRREKGAAGRLSTALRLAWNVGNSAWSPGTATTISVERRRRYRRRSANGRVRRPASPATAPTTARCSAAPDRTASRKRDWPP
jgi:hypothetical protein